MENTVRTDEGVCLDDHMHLWTGCCCLQPAGVDSMLLGLSAVYHQGGDAVVQSQPHILCIEPHGDHPHFGALWKISLKI